MNVKTSSLDGLSGERFRGLYAAMAAVPARRAPVDEGSNLSGGQLVTIMGCTLLAAVIFLYIVSG
jgi:hypothetical protein